MRSIEDLARIVFAFFVKQGDAKLNLIKTFETLLRPEIFSRVNFGNILRYISKKMGDDDDKNNVLNGMVDEFIDTEQCNAIKAIIIGENKKKYGISSERMRNIVGNPSIEKDKEKKALLLSPEDKTIQKKIITEFTPVISKYLMTYFTKKLMEWNRDKKETSRLEEDTPVDPTLFHEEVEKERKKWDLKLVHQFLDQNADEKYKDLYHLLLDEVLSDEMTPIDFAKKYNKKEDFINKRIRGLKLLLAKWFTDTGIGPKFVDEGLAKGEKIPKPPNYKIHLKDPENLKSFKEFLKYESYTEPQKRVIDLLLEAKSPKEIQEKLGITENSFYGIKKDKFDVLYKKWHEERIKKLKRAFYVRKAFMMMREANIYLPYEKVALRKTIPFKKKDVPEEGKEDAIAADHEKMVDYAIDKHRVEATIYFTANYDNLEVYAKRKDPEKDPVDFKYLSYEASFAKEKKGSKVDYRYTQKLKPDGTFIGTGDSSLKIDGTRVSPNNELKKKLDDFVENHMKPEGMLPYGRAMSGKTKNVLFPVGYENTKTGEEYGDSKNFIKKHNLLFLEDTIEDAVHKERTQDVAKREVGNLLPISERDQLREVIQDFKIELRDEKRKKPQDYKRIKEIESHLKELEKILKGEDVVEDIDALIEEEMKFLEPEHEKERTAGMVLPYNKIAAVFPPPESENVKKLMNIFDEYGVTRRPKPTGWLEPVDILTLAKTLKGRAKGHLDKSLKDLKKQKGITKNDKASQAYDLENKVRDDVMEASDLFKDIPADLKKRLGKLDEKDRTGLSNTGWVDDETEIDRIVRKVKMEFTKEVKPTPKKPEIMRSLEKNKFDSLQDFLELGKNGAKILAQRLNEASLTEEEMDPGFKEKVEKVLTKEEDELQSVKREMDVAPLKDKDEINTAVSAYVGRIKNLKEFLGKKEAPALSVAKAFAEKLKDFSSLFNLLSSTTWYGQYAHVTKAAEDEPTPEELADLKDIRSKIYNVANTLFKDNIFSKNAIKDGLAKLRALLKKFILEYDFHGRAASLPYSVVAAEEEKEIDMEKFEKARTKAIFPEDEMLKAKEVISDLKKEEKTKAEGDKAQSEFDKIVKNVSQAYKDGFSNKNIQQIAEKENISFNKASVRLKKIQDSIARKAISDFNLKWDDIKTLGPKKDKGERSGLGNKPHTEYDVMGDFVERHLKEVFKLTPPEKVPEEPARGVATPTAIREYIEEAFSKKTLEKFDIYEDSPGGGKGSGSKSKGRKKPIKIPPPNITLETIKDKIVQKFNEPANRIVLFVMGFYVNRIKAVLKVMKDEEYVDPGNVIDGLVTLLKQLQFHIANLKVEPSTSVFRTPPKGAPKLSGRPDIPIDNSSEAKKVFDKIKDIYKVINHYIAPDQVGIPPENLSTINKPIKNYLPRGLTDWYQHLEEQEKGKKSALSMAYRIAEKFAGTEIKEVDKYMEEDLITIK